ncbi:hypothetical protein SDJN03_17981, partial [Cucurbita argyrosperma subsp. sororia]
MHNFLFCFALMSTHRPPSESEISCCSSISASGSLCYDDSSVFILIIMPKTGILAFQEHFHDSLRLFSKFPAI